MLINSIKKIAFFVEGATELKFVEKLLQEILTKNKYTIQTREMRGGSKSLIEIKILNPGTVLATTECFILITDCGGDSTVKSYVLDQRDSLIKAGYSIIIGLLDLFPKTKTDLHNYKMGLNYKVPQVPLPIEFIISVMEIESWFIAEKGHFEKIHATLTSELINDKLGIDLNTVVCEDIPTPATTLNSIYNLAGKRYSKSAKQVQATVDSLDYGELYLTLPGKISSLSDLVQLINVYILA